MKNPTITRDEVILFLSQVSITPMTAWTFNLELGKLFVDEETALVVTEEMLCEMLNRKKRQTSDAKLNGLKAGYWILRQGHRGAPTSYLPSPKLISAVLEARTGK